MLKRLILFVSGALLLFSIGCTRIHVFPMTARAGDSVTVALGYDPCEARQKMSRADTVVTIEKENLSYLHVVDASSVPSLRGVFQLYPDPNSKLPNYTDYRLNTLSLNYGDPYETAVVFDLPNDMTPGNYNIEVRSTYTAAWNYSLEVIPGVGASNSLTETFGVDRELAELERVPVSSVAFSPKGFTVGVLSLVIDFDETQVLPSDINVLLMRAVLGPGKFTDTQSMLFWSTGSDPAAYPSMGDLLKVNICAPVA